jgi:hypothetical protein
MINDQSSNPDSVLGQKYAYATAALLAGIIGYVQMLGLEKAILAIIFAALALRSQPKPMLQDRRLWAKIAIVLGIIYFVLLPTIIIWKFESFKQLIDALEKLQ